MGNTNSAFSKKLPKFTLIFSLMTALIMALILGLQLNTITTTQQNHLALALSSQLAKVVRDPMIQQDALSLQVEVDEMLSIEGVQYAAVQDASHQLLVQAESPQTKATTPAASSHTSPITIENTVAGYAVIKLDPSFFNTPVQHLQLTFIFLWAVITLGLLWLSIHQGKNISGRLQHLLQQLPGENPPGVDELGCLEKRLEPLLANREPARSEAEHQHCTLLAITCKNLLKLETQVNQEHFESVMSQLDCLINATADLYGAQRLDVTQNNADNNTLSENNIYLKFAGGTTQNDHPRRALHCATIIRELSNKLLDKQGVELELAVAITQFEQQLTLSQLLNERALHTQINRLLSFLGTANNGDIVMDSDTQSHHSLQGVKLSPLTESLPTNTPTNHAQWYRADAINDGDEALITQQLTMLSHKLQLN